MAPTSATAAPRCGTPRCCSRRRTTTSSHSTRTRGRKNGTSRSPISISSTSRRAAPIVVDNHVLVGTGNDLDAPGFLQSYDPETGKLQWKFYTVPMNPGDPGLETWPNLDAARHGGGQVWIPGSYDPETRLYIFGTGNPTPGYTGVARPGDNLFTCSLVAVNVDTGKMAWYFQTSAHDTHDWDSAQTPILIDGVINGKPRKLVSTAARNGYFYTLDRVTGEHLVTSKYGSSPNWGKEMRPTGVISPDPGKEATIPGSLVSPVEGGVTNWPPAAYSPDTGLFYVQEHNGFNMLYLTDPDPRGSMGLGGKSVYSLGSMGDFLTAIDYRTGSVAWRHPFYGGGGGGGCSPPQAASCFPAMAAAISPRSTPPTENRSGIPGSATSRMRRRRFWSADASTCWSPLATLSTRSRCTTGSSVVQPNRGSR